MTGWEKELPQNFNLIIQTSGLRTYCNPSWRIRITNLSGILRYKLEEEEEEEQQQQQHVEP